MCMAVKYPRLTVDPLVFAFFDGKLQLLLSVRENEPQKGEFAIPGGHSYADQTTLDAIANALQQKTVVSMTDLSYIEQMYFFDTQNVDPRGHAVTLSFLCLVRPDVGLRSLQQGALWVDAHNVPKLAFDHISIVERALSELKQKLLTTTLGQFLLPEECRLNDICRLYEAVFARSFDNRNFRKKFLSFDVLTDTNKKEQGVANRPSKLYKFTENRLVYLYELKL